VPCRHKGLSAHSGKHRPAVELDKAVSPYKSERGPTRRCSCQVRADRVLPFGELCATMGAGTPAGAGARRLRWGGRGLAADRQVRWATAGKVIVRDGGVSECARKTALQSKGVSKEARPGGVIMLRLALCRRGTAWSRVEQDLVLGEPVTRQRHGVSRVALRSLGELWEWSRI
jgi:hypothetical protein